MIDRERLYLEIVLAVAQYFYYAGDGHALIPDHVYDDIERLYTQEGGTPWVGNAERIEKILNGLKK